jgi:hypothetical protein
MAGWNADAAAGPMGPQSVTLVQGSSFCISFLNGDNPLRTSTRSVHSGHPCPVRLELDR